MEQKLRLKISKFTKSDATAVNANKQERRQKAKLREP